MLVLPILIFNDHVLSLPVYLQLAGSALVCTIGAIHTLTMDNQEENRWPGRGERGLLRCQTVAEIHIMEMEIWKRCT